MTGWFIGVILLLAGVKAAGAADLPDAGRMLRESTPPPALLPPARVPAFELPPGPRRKELPAGIRLPVAGFSYRGNTVVSAAVLDRVMLPTVGRELTLAELEEAVSRITQYYRGRGYFLAEASIPPQTLKPGEPILVEIVEGWLEGVEIKTTPPQTRTPAWLLEAYRSKIPVGKPANQDDLTAAVLLLNELPALQTRIVLEPGKEPGSTRATLEVSEGRLYSASLFSDNQGNYSTGYYRLGAGLELYSPFRLGDRLSLRGQSSISGDTQSAALSWSLPLNGYGTRLILDYSWVGYRLGRIFAVLDATGTAHDITISLLQPLARRSSLFLNAMLGTEVRLLDDRIGMVSNSNRRHTIAPQAGLALYTVDSLLGGGVTSVSLNYTFGSLGFDDAVARQADQGPEGLHTEGRYHKLGGTCSRSQSIVGDLSLYAAFSGQWSSANLDSAEQISIGGPSGVRAYPVSEASADLGLITTVELRYLLPAMAPLPGRVQLAGLFDYGYAQIDAEPLADSRRNIRRLYGSGFGVTWQWDELVTLKSSVTWRMGELPTSDNTGGDKPTVYLQAVMRY